MTVTMTSVWEETQAFVRKEWSLLAPLALATLGVGNAGGQLVWTEATANGPMGIGIGSLVIMLAFLLLVLVGRLAITALVLGSRQSVGEALGAGGAALGRVVGANILVNLPFFLLLIPMASMLAKSGVSLTSVDPKIPGGILLYAFVLLLALTYVSIRLITLIPVLLDARLSVVDSLRAAWRQTGPYVWIILGVAILFLVVAFIVSTAFTAIFGMIFSLIAKAAGAPFLGLVLTALVAGMISAGFGIISNVFVAKLYARIGGAGAAQ